MPFFVVRNDITAMHTDAVVNAANESLLGGGGVDGAIHRAAGPGLLAECRKLGGCPTGQAKLTGGYDMHCRYIIHTVGPVWQGGGSGEEELLRSCYRASLSLAEKHGCETVAFPLISSGSFGYPKEDALQTAVSEITAFLQSHDMTVFLVIFDRSSFSIGKQLFSDIRSYIDDRYADAAAVKECSRPLASPFFDNAIPMEAMEPQGKTPRRHPKSKRTKIVGASAAAPERNDEPEEVCASQPALSVKEIDNEELERLVSRLDESFSEMLLRRIDEKGITDAACYKRANIDRKLFSKIRGDRLYRPSKSTVLCFAIALELPLPEVRDMLMTAGYALSHSNKSDLIIEYFISRRIYDIFQINEALFAFDQPLLGAS